MATFKFARIGGGIGHYASLSLLLRDDHAEFFFIPDTIPFFAEFQAAAIEGVQQALDWHLDSGGSPASFEVTGFEFTHVDTTPEAVRCAAIGAAWLALGHVITGLTFIWTGASWTVTRGR